MKKLSGGQAAVESLKAEKVEYVFGLIGSAAMEIIAFAAIHSRTECAKQRRQWNTARLL